MKPILFTFCLCFLIISCKQTESNEKAEIKELSTAEKIANAHGFKNWDKVTSFEFTFGGNDSVPNSGRSWIWNPKTNDITLVRNSDTTNYNRNSMDSIAINSDRAFINDKYWALVPFQLVWDEVTYSEKIDVLAPVSNSKMNKLTITYPSEGGYTPGDAYDIYYDKDFIIREWSFRKGNAAEPSISNTFENYATFNGIKIAKEHKRSESDRNLLIRNIKIEIEE